MGLSRAVPVHVQLCPAFAGTHFAYPWRDGQAVHSLFNNTMYERMEINIVYQPLNQ